MAVCRVASAPAILRLAILLLVAPVTGALAQTAVKYRDANGQWIFTDQAPNTASTVTEALHLPRQAEVTQIEFRRVTDEGVMRLLVTNHYVCVVNVRATVDQSTLAGVHAGSSYSAALDPAETRELLRAETKSSADTLHYHWNATLGSPQAQHHPPRPYRAPFPLGASYVVSQAYPTHITHVTADSRYAIDIALPDGTPVYAAREGTVINLRHDGFVGAIDPALLDQANVLEILHDDGTIALYAHLHWDSIRVHIGQRVTLGEYIADSGNTGFTSGPHLHFAVWRNSGGGEIAVPIAFAGLGGAPVTPETGVALTAY